MAKMHPPAAHGSLPLPLVDMAAIITGASSGIGRAIAVELAKSGADVLVHGHSNESGAKETANQIGQFGRDCRVELADLADERATAHLAEAAFAWRDDIAILINCAGVDVLTGEASEMSFEEKLHALWQVDVRGTMQLSRAVGRSMKERGTPRAAILTIGWDQAETGMAGDSGEMFAAIKGAVMAFTRSLAQSLAPEVRVNCLAPGWIKTAWGESASEYWQQRATGESLLARWGTPEDIAHTARFLVSPDAAFINGQIVRVNGGLGTTS